MENTVKKVDVAAIMERAKANTQSVKESTEKVGSKVDNFRIVPGFTKYEFNGNILRNVKTKSIISLKAKNGKYQLLSDDGKNCDRSKDQIIALFPVETKKEKTVKEPKQAKEPKVKKDKVVKEKKNTLKMQIMSLYNTGLTTKEVYSELQKTIPEIKLTTVQWNITKYKTK